MKKNTIIITILLFFAFPVISNAASQDKDSTSAGMTKEGIEMVMKLFDGQEISLIKIKANQLITSGKDSSDMAFIASAIFDYYYSSKIMGYEEVALYIADNYFLNKKLPAPDEEYYLLMKMFAEFNRASMIGMPAPELVLPDSLGNTISVKETGGKYKLLFFYDDQCATCVAYTPKLMKYLKTFESGSISVFRIYTQPDRERWTSWVYKLNARFTVSDKVKLYDIWDPEFTSDFQKKYGVVTTPQLVLLDENNVIIGRKLDPSAVAKIIDMDYNKPTEMQIFIDNLFTSLLPYDSSEDIDTTLITSTIDDLYKKTEKDTLFFRELFSTMYRYLKSHSEYDFQCGAAYIGDKYIAGKPSMWKNDSLVNATAKAVELFYRNQLGKPVADLYLTTVGKSPYSIYDSKAKFTVLYFYNMDCALCEAVTSDMKKIHDDFEGEDLEIIAIYTGKNKKKWTKYVSSLKLPFVNVWDKAAKGDMFSKYDLSGVPAIYLLDEKKIALAKDITPSILNDLLKYIFGKN